MKSRLALWVTFLAGLFYVLDFLLPSSFGGSPDSAGCTAPDLLPTSKASPNKGALLCYTGLTKEGLPTLLARSVTDSNGSLKASTEISTLIAPSYGRKDDYRGAQNGHFVGRDRLYYIGLGWDDKISRICLAKRDEESSSWRPEGEAVLSPGATGTWDSSGITWVSVLAPGEDSPTWRMWYIGRRGQQGRIGFAISKDGQHWSKVPGPVYELASGSVECVSVLSWMGSPRAWVVQKEEGQPESLVTMPLSSSDGRPADTPQSVAWQAPDLRFGNLPREAIPLRDARAIQDPESPRHVRLMLTTVSTDGKPRIITAENFAVTGSEEPTIFSRDPKPVLTPGSQPISNPISHVRGRVDDLVVIVGAFAVGLGLINLGQVHGARVLGRKSGWQDSIAFFGAAAAMTIFAVAVQIYPSNQTASHAYDVLFRGLYQPLGSSVFALLAAYLVSAAFRAFRIRNLETGIMAAAAILVMLGQVPIGNWLTQSLPAPLQIPRIMAWTIAVVNNGVIRALNFGIFVGAIATALRIWLQLDPAMRRGG